MKTLASVSFVAFVVLSTACFLPVTNQVDGAACEDESECQSGRCDQGFCSGSSCKLNDASTCNDGWKCIHSGPDPISGFFGADGSDTCRATCGHCPGNMHCAKGGKDGETLCTFGKAPLELSVQHPNAVAGQPVRLTAVATAPSGRLVKCEWSTGDAKPSAVTNGPELTHVFDNDTLGRQPQTFPIQVRCTDDGGRTGSVDAAIEVGCQPSVGACVPSLCCADRGFHCLASGGGAVCRLPVAPTVTITGPTTVPLYIDAEFTAALSGGEGEAVSFSWTFSDTSFDRNGTTIEHSFSKAGAATVRARGRTSLGQDVEQTHTVMVCSTQNSRCSDTEPCCAPLGCKASGSTMRCLP
jgi:hypothetical protein